MIEKLLNNVRKEILDEFQAIATCLIYPSPREKIIAPAVFLEIANYKVNDDTGTEELSLIMNAEARVVIDSLIPNAELECQKLAYSVASLIHLNNFNSDMSLAKVTGISRDYFKPDFDPYICWLIEWQQEFYVGKSVFQDDNIGVSPHEIHINGEVV